MTAKEVSEEILKQSCIVNPTFDQVKMTEQLILDFSRSKASQAYQEGFEYALNQDMKAIGLQQTLKNLGL